MTLLRSKGASQGTARPKSAHDFLKLAEKIIADREASHGEIVRGQNKIATLWNAYLEIRREPNMPLDAEDTTAMMQLLKMARGQSGTLLVPSGLDDIDHDLDNIGYAAKLAEVRAAKRRCRK